MSFAYALKWSFLAEIAAKAIQPVVFIALARLLTPEDFGVMTAAMMVIAFSQIFWEAGMGKALIQRQTDVEAAANAAFWINVGLGLFMAVLLYASARPIALTFFQDERVTAVLQVMTLQIMLGALSSVQTALLQKEMDFKRLFWVRFATITLPGLASIPLAWYGWGYWALVAGSLVGQLVQTVILWSISHWRPAIRFRSSDLQSLTRFGAWVSGVSLLAWYYQWIDMLFIGKYLGAKLLGEYRIAAQLNTLIFSMIFAPVLPVLYAHLAMLFSRRLQSDSIIQTILAIAAWLSIPVGLSVFLLSQPIVEFALTTQWEGAESIIAWMAIIQMLGHLSAFNGEVYRATNRPDLEGKVWLVGVLFYTPAYYMLAKTSMDAFLAGRVILVILFYFMHVWIMSNALAIGYTKLLGVQLRIVLPLLAIGTAVARVASTYFAPSDLNHFIAVTCFWMLAVASFCLIESKRLLPRVTHMVVDYVRRTRTQFN